MARERPRLPLRRELSDCIRDLGSTTEGEITRGRCLHRGADEHQVKKRSFAFSLAYIKCFRTYSVYLSLRLPAQILYAGIHLCPLAVLRSCFGYSLSHLRTAAACLSRCIRHRRRSAPHHTRRGPFAADFCAVCGYLLPLQHGIEKPIPAGLFRQAGHGLPAQGKLPVLPQKGIHHALILGGVQGAGAVYQPPAGG